MADEEGSSMANQHIPVTGGCLCGAVRYESREPPTEGYYCHCTMCRKHYGGLFAAAVRIPGVALKFTKSQPKYYRSSAWAKRGFCSDCGSPVAFFFEGDPDAWISVGSLDHPEDWPMTKHASWGQSMHVFIDTKIPWYVISDGLPQRESDVLSEAARAYAAKTSQ
jgi:hypothetical protein